MPSSGPTDPPSPTGVAALLAAGVGLLPSEAAEAEARTMVGSAVQLKLAAWVPGSKRCHISGGFTAPEGMEPAVAALERAVGWAVLAGALLPTARALRAWTQQAVTRGSDPTDPHLRRRLRRALDHAVAWSEGAGATSAFDQATSAASASAGRPASDGSTPAGAALASRREAEFDATAARRRATDAAGAHKRAIATLGSGSPDPVLARTLGGVACLLSAEGLRAAREWLRCERAVLEAGSAGGKSDRGGAGTPAGEAEPGAESPVDNDKPTAGLSRDSCSSQDSDAESASDSGQSDAESAPAAAGRPRPKTSSPARPAQPAASLPRKAAPAGPRTPAHGGASGRAATSSGKRPASSSAAGTPGSASRQLSLAQSFGAGGAAASGAVVASFTERALQARTDIEWVGELWNDLLAAAGKRERENALEALGRAAKDNVLALPESERAGAAERELRALLGRPSALPDHMRVSWTVGRALFAPDSPMPSSGRLSLGFRWGASEPSDVAPQGSNGSVDVSEDRDAEPESRRRSGEGQPAGGDGDSALAGESGCPPGNPAGAEWLPRAAVAEALESRSVGLELLRALGVRNAGMPLVLAGPAALPADLILDRASRGDSSGAGDSSTSSGGGGDGGGGGGDGGGGASARDCRADAGCDTSKERSGKASKRPHSASPGPESAGRPIPSTAGGISRAANVLRPSEANRWAALHAVAARSARGLVCGANSAQARLLDHGAARAEPARAVAPAAAPSAAPAAGAAQQQAGADKPCGAEAATRSSSHHADAIVALPAEPQHPLFPSPGASPRATLQPPAAPSGGPSDGTLGPWLPAPLPPAPAGLTASSACHDAVRALRLLRRSHYGSADAADALANADELAVAGRTLAAATSGTVRVSTTGATPAGRALACAPAVSQHGAESLALWAATALAPRQRRHEAPFAAAEAAAAAALCRVYGAKAGRAAAAALLLTNVDPQLTQPFDGAFGGDSSGLPCAEASGGISAADAWIQELANCWPDSETVAEPSMLSKSVGPGSNVSGRAAKRQRALSVGGSDGGGGGGSAGRNVRHSQLSITDLLPSSASSAGSASPGKSAGRTGGSGEVPAAVGGRAGAGARGRDSDSDSDSDGVGSDGAASDAGDSSAGDSDSSAERQRRRRSKRARLAGRNGGRVQGAGAGAATATSTAAGDDGEEARARQSPDGRSDPESSDPESSDPESSDSDSSAESSGSESSRQRGLARAKRHAAATEVTSAEVLADQAAANKRRLHRAWSANSSAVGRAWEAFLGPREAATAPSNHTGGSCAAQTGGTPRSSVRDSAAGSAASADPSQPPEEADPSAFASLRGAEIDACGQATTAALLDVTSHLASTGAPPSSRLVAELMVTALAASTLEASEAADRALRAASGGGATPAPATSVIPWSNGWRPRGWAQVLAALADTAEPVARITSFQGAADNACASSGAVLAGSGAAAASAASAGSAPAEPASPTASAAAGSAAAGSVADVASPGAGPFRTPRTQRGSASRAAAARGSAAPSGGGGGLRRWLGGSGSAVRSPAYQSSICTSVSATPQSSRLPSARNGPAPSEGPDWPGGGDARGGFAGGIARGGRWCGGLSRLPSGAVGGPVSVQPRFRASVGLPSSLGPLPHADPTRRLAPVLASAEAAADASARTKAAVAWFDLAAPVAEPRAGTGPRQADGEDGCAATDHDRRAQSRAAAAVRALLMRWGGAAGGFAANGGHCLPPLPLSSVPPSSVSKLRPSADAAARGVSGEVWSRVLRARGRAIALRFIVDVFEGDAALMASRWASERPEEAAFWRGSAVSVAPAIVKAAAAALGTDTGAAVTAPAAPAAAATGRVGRRALLAEEVSDEEQKPGRALHEPLAREDLGPAFPVAAPRLAPPPHAVASAAFAALASWTPRSAIRPPPVREASVTPALAAAPAPAAPVTAPVLAPAPAGAAGAPAAVPSLVVPFSAPSGSARQWAACRPGQIRDVVLTAARSVGRGFTGAVRARAAARLAVSADPAAGPAAAGGSAGDSQALRRPVPAAASGPALEAALLVAAARATARARAATTDVAAMWGRAWRNRGADPRDGSMARPRSTAASTCGGCRRSSADSEAAAGGAGARAVRLAVDTGAAEPPRGSASAVWHSEARGWWAAAAGGAGRRVVWSLAAEVRAWDCEALKTAGRLLAISFREAGPCAETLLAAAREVRAVSRVCPDLARRMVVSLPQGSALRAMLGQLPSATLFPAAEIQSD